MSKNETINTKPHAHGSGGVFFKARDPQVLADWYREHPSFPIAGWGGASFAWKRADFGAEGCQGFDRREDAATKDACT